MIDEATTDDLDDVVDLWMALLDSGHDDGVQLLAEENRSAIRRQLAAATVDGRVLVARSDGLIGFASIRIERGGLESAHARGIVENLFVTPERRDERIGSKLLSAAEDRLRDRGAEVLLVETPARNEAARRLYRSHGYEPHRIEFAKRSDRKQ